MDNRRPSANWQMPVEYRLITTNQALLITLYLLLSFPLGLFYFIYLVCGISIGIGTLIIWIGVPITLLTVIGWRYLAAFRAGDGDELAECRNPTHVISTPNTGDLVAEVAREPD